MIMMIRLDGRYLSVIESAAAQQLILKTWDDEY
jgi:hypothetical protein